MSAWSSGHGDHITAILGMRRACIVPWRRRREDLAGCLDERADRALRSCRAVSPVQCARAVRASCCQAARLEQMQ